MGLLNMILIKSGGPFSQQESTCYRILLQQPQDKVCDTSPTAGGDSIFVTGRKTYKQPYIIAGQYEVIFDSMPDDRATIDRLVIVYFTKTHRCY